ncbi:Uncharacterised protein [Acinetobacter haemolyticus]|nr:Uncharacterised protein [Acinetobacter haemolyticus]
MLVISVGVLIYQIIIFAIIVGSRSSGRGAVLITTFIACLWTLTHVFFPPLMILQFIVIAIAFFVAMT